MDEVLEKLVLKSGDIEKAHSEAFRLQDLPIEIRIEIYELLLRRCGPLDKNKPDSSTDSITPKDYVNLQQREYVASHRQLIPYGN